MSRSNPTTSSDSTVRAELLFLIARFLSNTPCQQAANVLLQELRKHELLPKGVDWEGNERTRTYDQLVRMNGHIGPDYLQQICQRVGPLLDQLVPSSTYGVQSLLSAGSMSLLRTAESLKNNRWKLSHQMVLQNGCSRVLPKGFIQPSFVQSINARRYIDGGMTARKVPATLYSEMKLFDTKCGHLLPAYCSIFDRTGQYVITGADDALVKIWHFHSGRLLATLRGHSAEVSDLDVSYENTLVASGSYDKVVRVWCLQTKAPVAVLQGHTSMITTVQFSPHCKGDTRILMTTGADGCVCFWLWNLDTMCFNSKPKKFVERSHAGAKMLCAAFSTGGMFAATGSSDHVVRVYFLYASEPTKICELEAHGDMVGCISYSGCSNRFVSGSDDGTARIWHYERQDWKDTVLNMNTTVNQEGKEVSPDEDAKLAKELNVTMVTWNLDESMVVTAVMGLNIDYVRIKVWDSHSGKLRHDLKGHEMAVYVLDASPVDPRIVLSSGHDGHIFIWDIMAGVKVKHFCNFFEGQGAIPVFDCKFTPDGQAMTATDSYGQVLFFGFGNNQKLKEVPVEVFFHTDYRPLIRDANNFVLDEETQLAPHLMPPPYLVNVLGSPYPAALQRLVPGREDMTDSQLVPQFVISEQGISLVIGDGEVQEGAQLGDAPLPEPDNQRQLPNHRRQHLNNQRQPVNNQRQMANNQRQAINNRRQSASARVENNERQQRLQLAGQAAQEPAAAVARILAQPQDHDYSRHRNDHDDDDSDDGSEDERAEVPWNSRRARPSIDEMIRQLQHEQDERILAQGGELPMASPPRPAAAANVQGDRSRPLQGGEGGQPQRGEEDRAGAAAADNPMPDAGPSSDESDDSKRVVVYLLNPAELKKSEEKRMAMAEDEIRRFILERKKKQSVPNTPSTLFGNMSRGKTQDKKTSKQAQASRNRLTTRALYDTEEEEEVETEESESESDSSYSDWTMEGSSNLQPPKRRSKRKPKRRQISSSEDEDEDEEAELAIQYADDDDDDDDNDDEDFKVYVKPSKKGAEKKEEVKEEGKKKTPQDKKEKKPYKRPKKGLKKEVEGKKTEIVAAAAASKDKKTKKPSKRKSDIDKNNFPEITELKPEFMPPEWLTGTIPRKTPFVPQMGDEVMYFRQGHELYLHAVERHKSYEISSNISLPWQKNPHLREVELVKIVGIRYEVKPPRLCSLKLAYINSETGKMLGGSFSVRYHDMPDVIDFLVLRQHFELARQRCWKPGDRFRSMIDDQWWMGTIESQSPLNPIFSDSMFQCFNVHWDNGEYERLSPWDMEPVNENLLPSSVGGGVPVDPEELRGMLYMPRPNEWSSTGLEAETQRIVQGLEAVMEHSAAQPFNAPVDLSAFPLYAVIIEYPIDLSTIKARLENGYYRRINALQWDVRHIESNAKKFNEDGTPIFRSAGIITETLLKFISDPSCQDPMPILEELSRGQEFHWGGREGGAGDGDDGGGGGGADSSGEGPSRGASTSSKRKRGKEESRSNKRQRVPPQPHTNQWKQECSDLLTHLMERDDASPFVAPVDPHLYPNYNDIIDTPMDFGTVRSRLQREEYTSPQDFAKDVRLIFHNSRTFNTNRKSRIYTMTARLSSLFESLLHKILTKWRSLSKNKHSSGSIVASSSTAAEESSQQAGPSTHSRHASLQEFKPSVSRPGPSSESRSHTSGRSSEEDMRTLARRMVPRPADDTDSEKTEVEDDDDDEGKQKVQVKQEMDRTKSDDDDDDDEGEEDEDTEIEDDDSNAPVPAVRRKPAVPSSRSTSRSQPLPARPATPSSDQKSYRTRAKTGSLRPKRYISSDEEDDRDVRKNSKRAPSHSSRDSSFQHDIEEEADMTTEISSDSESTSDTDNSTSKQRKQLSKLVRSKRKKAASKSRRQTSKSKKALHAESPSDESDSDSETEESDSDSDECPRKTQPRRRTEVDIDTQTSCKKPPGSGKRTTRNQGKRTFNYLEDSGDEYEDDPSRVSVSSRGRVRRMTKRARANRVDD